MKKWIGRKRGKDWKIFMKEKNVSDLSRYKLERSDEI
jgi:hypothetical protein